MKRLIVVLSLMIILFSQPAIALTKLTESEMNKVSAQFGILSTIGLSELIKLKDQPGKGLYKDHAVKKGDLESFGKIFDFAGGTRETLTRITDAVIDIDHVEIDLFKTEQFSLGHIIMNGIHIEIPDATISVWNH